MIKFNLNLILIKLGWAEPEQNIRTSAELKLDCAKISHFISKSDYILKVCKNLIIYIIIHYYILDNKTLNK